MYICMYISRVFGNRESERLLGASPFTYLSQLHLKNCLRFVLGNGEKHTHTQRNRTICFFASVPKILHTHTYIERVLGASPSPHFSQFLWNLEGRTNTDKRSPVFRRSVTHMHRASSRSFAIHTLVTTTS